MCFDVLGGKKFYMSPIYRNGPKHVSEFLQSPKSVMKFFIATLIFTCSGFFC